MPFNALFAELKQLEVHPVPENLVVADLSWYELDVKRLCACAACMLYFLTTASATVIEGICWIVSPSGCVRAANWRCWISTTTV